MEKPFEFINFRGENVLFVNHIFFVGGGPHGRNSGRLYWSPSHPSSGCSQPNCNQRTKYHSIVCAGKLVLSEVV